MYLFSNKGKHSEKNDLDFTSLNRRKFAKVFLPVIVIFSYLFAGWGNVGHAIINKNTILTALPEMSFFQSWVNVLVAHASDADYRKSDNPDEKPKHYIDIDNYPEFISSGSISHNFDSLVSKYGYAFVLKQGILPWAILAAAESLEVALKNKDENSAMLLAADLGHYVGDAHMPLHITKNYDGQYSNQTGIHSRYESTMIQKYQAQLIYNGDSLKYIQNLPDYVFKMITDNYKYVDSLLAAEKAAKSFANGSTSSTVYYDKLWQLSKKFTLKLFKDASHKLTCIIYTKWINANGTVNEIDDNPDKNVLNYFLSQNYPNPFNPSTKIRYSIPVITNRDVSLQWVTLKVYDILGNEVATLVNEEKAPGSYEVEFSAEQKNITSLTSGVYIYRITSGNYSESKKILLLK